MRQKTSPKMRRVLNLALTSCVLYAVLNASVIADTIYRCGDEYSYAQRCHKNQLAQPTNISDQHVTPQENVKLQTTSLDLKDADLLEKSRIQSERNMQANIQRRENFNKSKFQFKETQPKQNIPELPSHRRRRSSASQYFTAKDPIATKQTK